MLPVQFRTSMECDGHGPQVRTGLREGWLAAGYSDPGWSAVFPISAKMPDTDQRQKLMPFVGKYVRASGIVFERTGTHAIVITEIKEMKEVRLTIDEE